MASRPLTSRMAALLALYDLGGAGQAVDTEDIAMRAAQVSPKSFRWRRYPEQVNLEAARIALKDNKSATPSTVSGGVRNGWQLTREGIVACLEFRNEADPGGKDQTNRIRGSAVFSAWQRDGEEAISRDDLMDLLRVNDYFPEAKRRQRVLAVTNATLTDPELMSFVEAAKRRHPEVMRT